MQVQDVMSRHIEDIGRLMTQYDAERSPVCDERRRRVGVVTDRDIVCGILAREENPLERRAAGCMSEPVVTATPETES